MSLINKVLYNIDQRNDTTSTQKETARRNIGAYEDKTIDGGGTGIPKSDLASDVQASLDKADSALQAAVEYVTTSSTWQTLETAYNAGKTLILKVENGSNWFDEYRITAVNKSSGSDRFIFCGFPTTVNLNGGSVKSLEVTEWICYLDGSATRWMNSPTVNGVELTTKDYVAQALTSCMILSKLTSDDREIPDVPGTVVIGDMVYPFVQIGNQLWITQNLDWKFNGLDVGNSGVSDSYPKANYYNNDENTYGQNGLKYGLLYNYWAAIEINSMLTDGWRVPSQTDWEKLFNYVSNYGNVPNILKSKTGWNQNYNGIDAFGFEAKPSGGKHADGFEHIGTIGIFCSATETSASHYYRPFIQYNQTNVNIYNGSSGFEYWYTWYQSAIRLVKDIV